MIDRGHRRAAADRRRAQPGDGRTSGEDLCRRQASTVAAATDTAATDRRRVAGRAPVISPEPGRVLTEADFGRLIEAIRRERERPRNDETCPD